ncbi:MAG: DUF4440 domain-containing protein [Pseudomonadales bacterium]|nr:DUF4440 domain-containing protein [Halioglobus sp.]MCP5130319.1 DUF4440 domain-containing protein [Pseudomonadales bacterium]
MNNPDILKKLELELVSPDTRRNPRRLSELLSDEFEEYGSSGRVFTKSDVLSGLPETGAPEYELFGFSFLELSPECMLVKYRSTVSGRQALRSSIWIFGSGQWQLLHHQSTVIPE